MGAVMRQIGRYAVESPDGESDRAAPAAWRRHARLAPARSSTNTVLGKLGPERIAIHAEHVGGLRLVAAGAMHDHRQQRSFDVGDHHVVNPARLLAVEPLKI